jgi:hypothetical protein
VAVGSSGLPLRSVLSHSQPSAVCGVIKVHQDAFALDGSGALNRRVMPLRLSF